MIDVHIHLTPPEIANNRDRCLAGENAWADIYSDPKARMISEPDLLLMMSQEGVAKAVVTGFPWANLETAKRHNYWLLEVAERNRGRIYPLAAFDILAPWAIKHAEEMLKAGAFGLGELCLYDRGFGPRELDLFEELGALCRSYGRVMMVHVNEPIGHHYPGKAPLEIGQIFELVRRCQGLKLILAHFGGGLPFLASLKKEVREFLHLVRFDTAAMPFLYNPVALPMALQILSPEYFLLGTDYPLLKPSRYLRYFEEAGLDRATRNIIIGEAAADFLELS